jgi:hypothetical protein
MAKHEQAYERLGAKVLTLPDVIAQSVGVMGPVFSSAFVIPLVVGVISASGKGGGVASPLSVLIAAVGTLPFDLRVHVRPDPGALAEPQQASPLPHRRAPERGEGAPCPHLAGKGPFTSTLSLSVGAGRVG